MPITDFSKLKVLFIGLVWPESRSSAAGSHILSQVHLFLARQAEVLFASTAQKTEHSDDLARQGVTTVSIELNASSFDSFIERLQPDIVIYDRFMVEEQFGWRVDRQCPSAIKILDTEDLQCLRQARQQALQEQRQLNIGDLHSDLAKREIAAILRCDLSLIISDFEIKLLQQLFHIDHRLLHHLPFLVTPQEEAAPLPGFDQRRHFVTIGNFRHAPNWDSTLYLQQIWPLIRQQLPDTELHIYGAYPPAKAFAMDNPDTGFRILGRATDAIQVLQQARVCLAPLRFGAGIKGKLLDAMLAGTPSVTSDIGAEGMADTEEWPGKVANKTEEIAQAAITLYCDEQQWKQAQQQISPILQQRFNAKIQGERLLKRIIELLQSLQSHRAANFTGAMLRHHSLRSTEYLSRWIELKNRLKETTENRD